MSDVIVTVVGGGAIGASIGLALKQMEDPPRLIVHDKKAENARAAMKMKAFDKSEWNLINACDKADLIILALPISEIRPTLKALVDDLKEDVIISDTAQMKYNIVEMAENILPAHAHFVGGNPIVSTPGSGPNYARADLFNNSIYCLTPSAIVTPDGVKLLEDMVTLIGATSFFLNPLEHDGLMSAVNDLPTLLGLALMNSVSQPASWNEMRKLAGGLFSQVTAGASGDPDSLAEGLIANKSNVSRWIDTTIASLQYLKTLIDNEELEPLAQAIDKAVVERTNWQKDFEQDTLSVLESSNATKIEKPNMFRQMFGFGNRNK